MRATDWKGAVYGIRVGKANASRFFPRGCARVEVDLDGDTQSFRLSETFWTTCPEIRGAPIEQWLRAHGLAPWQSRRPPEVRLVPLGGNRFRLVA